MCLFKERTGLVPCVKDFIFKNKQITPQKPNNNKTPYNTYSSSRCHSGLCTDYCVKDYSGYLHTTFLSSNNTECLLNIFVHYEVSHAST